MKRAINTYHRPDGVIGCGFYGEFGGLWQHSISWPDQPSARMRTEDLEDRKIDVKSLAVVPVGDRDLIDMAGRPPVDNYTTTRPRPIEVDTTRADVGGGVNIIENVLVAPPESPAETSAPEDASPFDSSASEAENIRRAIAADPDATNRDIITLLNSHGVNVSSSQISRERRAIAAVAEAETAASEEPASEEGEAEE